MHDSWQNSAGKECINKPLIHKTNIHLYHIMFMAFEVCSIAKSWNSYNQYSCDSTHCIQHQISHILNGI